jgi:hypothetical protein
MHVARAKAKRNLSINGMSIPEWGLIKKDIKPFKTSNGVMMDYKQLLQSAMYYVHYEVSVKTLQSSFIKYCERFDKKNAALLNLLPEYEFASVGKNEYIFLKGAEIEDTAVVYLEQKYSELLVKAEKISKVKAAEAKQKVNNGIVISIQQRMREQVSDLCGQWDDAVDQLCFGEFDLNQFDPHSQMQVFNSGVIKAAHAKIIKDMYQSQYEEAKEVVEWTDEQIKEGYSYMTAKKRKEFLAFFEKIMTACDTYINTGKAVRKTRVKKAPSKEKLVARIKYKESEPSIGLASVNPLSIIECNTLWIYNTKNRKLGCYVADSMGQVLTVKGTSIVGFDPKKSVCKTVRKPEMLKGAGKLPRTKMQKQYDEIRATETVMNGRLNEHIILISTF